MLKIFTNGLTDSINLLKNRFNVVEELTQDVDIILQNPSGCQFSSDDLSLTASVMNIPILAPSRRLNKLEQNIILERIGILTPKSFYNKHTLSPLKGMGEIDAHYGHLKEFVTKPLLGARGWGVKKLTRTELIEILYDEKKPSYDEPTMSREDSEEFRFTKDALREFRFIVQEPVDIKREFRMILTPKQNMIYERQINQTNDGLSKANITDSFDYDNCMNIDYNKTKVRDIINKLRRDVIEVYKFPFLSVDLYEDVNGNYGVMEFQMEFAYEGFRNNIPRLVEILCDSIDYYYENFSEKIDIVKQLM